MANRIEELFGRRPLIDFGLIFIGAVIQAVGLNIFLIPAQVAAGGVSGLAQLLNHVYGLPVGILILVGNLPLFALGWRYLGGFRFASRTVFSVFIYALAIEVSAPLLPAGGLSNDNLLNALYGGVIVGIGIGIVYRGRGTSGGTDILARIINHYRGMPLSTIYMLTDAVVILIAGFIFGWENALYALVALYITGLTAETVTQGSRVVRTALIVTNQPDMVGQGILHEMGRGVTRIEATGAYTGAARAVLYVVVSRAEVEPLKSIVRRADEKAFLVIGQAYEALGEGFDSIQPN
jgi:uncharacterized membrane-anchored protein YitT (DUF2179 family)